MAVGGVAVWLVRIVGSLALGQEAMGFGDVTLMGMIGAFLGWQPALLVFFLAPFTGVLIAVSQWLLTGRKDIAYGPFLCLAALLAGRRLGGGLAKLGIAYFLFGFTRSHPLAAEPAVAGRLAVGDSARQSLGRSWWLSNGGH